MKTKWKNRKGLAPQIILGKIEAIKKVSQDGRVSFLGFEYHDAIASLFSLLDFPPKVLVELNVSSLLTKAVSDAARRGELTKDALLNSLNAIASDRLATPEREFRLLTSLSVNGVLPFKRKQSGSESVRVIDGSYPNKYVSRNRIIQEHRPKKFAAEHVGYSKVIVSVRAKSARGAASKGLDFLDAHRAILALFCNSGMEIIGNPHKPINKIRLGQVHTLHSRSGAVYEDHMWYEPNFVDEGSFTVSNSAMLKKNFEGCYNKLANCPYQSRLQEGLLKFVRALDEKDPNSAAIRLWGALESLACPDYAKYGKIVSRVSFLFEDEKYHRQVLEHLREFRNHSVHSGDQSEKAKTYCFQMQFYFRELMFFHLAQVGNFASLGEANDFLDLPTDRNRLLAMNAQIQKAIAFREIER